MTTVAQISSTTIPEAPRACLRITPTSWRDFFEMRIWSAEKQSDLQILKTTKYAQQ
jgi:hypothetical protein